MSYKMESVIKFHILETIPREEGGIGLGFWESGRGRCGDYCSRLET